MESPPLSSNIRPWVLGSGPLYGRRRSLLGRRFLQKIYTYRVRFFRGTEALLLCNLRVTSLKAAKN